MAHKKLCQCGFIVLAKSPKAAGEAIKDHCDHAGCNALEAKNV